MEGSPHLPDDIIFRILPYVPAKSLARIKTVSKSWNGLINSRNFVRQHYSRQPSSKLLMAQTNAEEEDGACLLVVYPWPLTVLDSTSKDSLSHDPNAYEPFKVKPYTCNTEIIKWVMGPCFGVFCFGVNTGRRYRYPAPAFTITLCNITTGETKVLPTLDSFEGKLEHSHTAYGFGCIDSVVGPVEFKLVCLCLCIWKNVDGGRIINRSARVYNSTTNSWKSIQAPAGLRVDDHQGKGTEVNGVIYWLAAARGEACSTGYRKIILTFDLEEEVFGSIEMPCQDIRALVLTKQGDQCLSLIADSDTCADIWVMHAGESSWVRQARVESKFHRESWLGYWHNVEGGGESWRVRRAEDGIAIIIGDKCHKFPFKANTMVCDYVQSLVSLNF